jgi:hypothetical protein
MPNPSKKPNPNTNTYWASLQYTTRDAQNTKKGKTQNQNFTPKLKTLKKSILFQFLNFYSKLKQYKAIISITEAKKEQIKF